MRVVSVDLLWSGLNHQVDVQLGEVLDQRPQEAVEVSRWRDGDEAGVRGPGGDEGHHRDGREGDEGEV